MNTFVRLHNLPNRRRPIYTSPTTGLDALIANFFHDTNDSHDAAGIKIDVSENEKNYWVSATLPGAKKDEIQLAIEKNTVTIGVEIKQEATAHPSENEGAQRLHRERFYGKTSRTFKLAQEIDEAKVDAKYVDGVLTLTLPKKAPEAAKRITIN